MEVKTEAANTKKSFLIMLNNPLQVYINKKRRVTSKNAGADGDLIVNIIADKVANADLRGYPVTDT